MSSAGPSPSPRPIRPTSSPALEGPDPKPTGPDAPSVQDPPTAAQPARPSTRTSPNPGTQAVKAYLDAFDACGRTTELRDAELESLRRRKKSLEAKVAKASSWQSLKLYSDIEEIEVRLGDHRKAKKAAERLAQLEPEFIEHASSYAQGVGIPSQRFARLGIEKRVLVEAGLA